MHLLRTQAHAIERVETLRREARLHRANPFAPGVRRFLAHHIRGLASRLEGGAMGAAPRTA